MENSKDTLNWGFVFALLDILIILGMTHLWFYSVYNDLQMSVVYVFSILLLSLSVLFASYHFGVYKYWRQPSAGREIRAIITAWLTSIAFMSVLAFLLKVGAQFSRSWFLLSCLTSVLLIVLVRTAFRILMIHFNGKDWNRQNIVIIGNDKHIETLSSLINNQWWTGVNIISSYGYSKYLNHTDPIQNEKSILANISEFLSKCNAKCRAKKQRICQVWVVLEDLSPEVVSQLNKALNIHPVDIVYVPNLSLIADKNELLFIAGIPVIKPKTSSLTINQRFFKYVFDYILAFIIVILISPLLLIIAIGVKLSSPGPVFYRQQRVTLHGKKFEMLKFRSMPVNVESKTGAVWAKAGENRATKFGAFLRRTSLDELPQFINVLKGDMSIVGPRPERPEFVETFKLEIPRYMHKHLLKAGITGWAQVNGYRGNTSLSKRIEYDLYYIKHWSLIFDFRIILMTFYKGFVHRSAY